MTLISTACSWVNMFGGHKAAIFTQVGQFYFGRWVSFSSAVTADLDQDDPGGVSFVFVPAGQPAVS